MPEISGAADRAALRGPAADPRKNIAMLADFIGAGSQRRIEAARRSIRLPQ
jgi:hypothetical protein